MAAPLLFIAIPLLAAPLVYLLHPVRAAALTIAVALTVVLALAALFLPLGRSAGWLAGAIVADSSTILGRQFLIEPGDRLALSFAFGQAALLFLVSGAGRGERFFLPVGLANLGLLAAALFVRPFLFAAFFIELSVAMATLMLVPVRRGPPGGTPITRGALRYLVYTTLGVPFILLTGWLLEASAASPGDPTFIQQASLLLMFGFAVLMAVVPFHSWLPEVAEHASPFATAFVFTVIRLGILFLLLTFLDTYPWLEQNPVVFRALTVAGGAMTLVGALFTFGQRNFGRVVGYIMMIDIGAEMLGIGLGTRPGVEAALITLALRGLELPLWALGLDRLRQAVGSDQFDALSGRGRRYPMAAAAVLLGLLSMAGFPLLAGFTGRWGLLRLLAQIHPTAAILLFLGTVSTALVCARGLAALVQPLEAPAPGGPVFEWPGRFRAALYALGLTVLLALGIFPQWLLPAVARTAAVFTNLGR